MQYFSSQRWLFGCCLAGLLLLAAADAKMPTAPKSPKATDALRMDAAAIKKAVQVYWLTCQGADEKLKYQLQLAADAAHKRNDGVEKQARLDAEKDVSERIDHEMNAQQTGSVEDLKPLRFEKLVK